MTFKNLHLFNLLSNFTQSCYKIVLGYGNASLLKWSKKKNPSLKEDNNEIIPKERSAELKIKLGMKHKPLFLIIFCFALHIFR